MGAGQGQGPLVLTRSQEWGVKVSRTWDYGPGQFLWL